jgi:hypothetical protein
MGRESLKWIDKRVEQPTAIDGAKTKAHQPIAGQILILNAAQR